jgi:ketosteroid isomerase-like protein
MSQENVEMVRAWYEAFNRRDFEAFLEFVDDEAEFESRLIAMEGDYHGHEGVRRWWENFLGVFPDYTVEVLEVRDLGDITLAHLRGRAHGADSATPLVDSFWQLHRWGGGRWVWTANLSTEAEALEAAGLRE